MKNKAKTYLQLTRKSILGFLVLLATHQAHAFDIEVDPIAYGLNGYSLHAGFGNNYFRFDLGLFGLEIPESSLSNENYEVDFTGYGIKLDYLFGRYEGLFVGLQANTLDYTYTLTTTGTKEERRQKTFGPRVGYRFLLGPNLTLTPWMEAAIDLDHDDVVIDGERYENELITFFPTVHLGWRF